ncbi:MAG: malate dehydrogenase, malate dehydrogenase [Candidatus Peregrinibacteria bacterium GW2011_GWF2_33_10]|nr:MAG: malate dehydrogenase, malate dehydrogenase [Candidatus Peregrinibacteria bacterium GW2011_GWF2_33_10]OGJ44989.1 MAG: malate dehydrogenase [Candidatus Peregrinibacteria bacterium RIFOXYA2_FULL_33_21]OGJ47463.1 MAG: malate dehydrogenase [Candidatus Peregrinibacteria bacterium RIFOXYA12_FULL_33_12]
MKISIIGAGFVGSTTAYRLVERKMCHELVLFDVNEGIAKGKALDLRQAAPFLSSDVVIFGTSDYKQMANSNIVIITAGSPRLPGMSRDDLLVKNASIMKSIVPQIVKYAPNCIIICVTNPLDIITYLVYKLSGFDSSRVIGMAGLLDSVRFKAFLAEKLNVSASQIQTMVLGTHGDTMIPLINHTFVAGIPLKDLMSKKDIEASVDRTRHAGAEIVAHLKTGSAYFAPAGSIFEMVQAIVRNQRRIVPASAYLQGEYGFKNVYLGVPVKLGANGLEEIVEINLSDSERKALTKAYAHVQGMIKALIHNRI